MVVGLVCAPTHGMSIGGGFCQTSGHWHRPLHPARPAWQLRVSARRSRNQRLGLRVSSSFEVLGEVDEHRDANLVSGGVMSFPSSFCTRFGSP